MARHSQSCPGRRSPGERSPVPRESVVTSRAPRLPVVIAAALSLFGAYQAEARGLNSGTTRNELRPPSMANASVTVVEGLSIETEEDLDFGEVVASGTAGTVVMTPAGRRTATGGTRLGDHHDASAAVFEVEGERRATVSITLPGSITLESGPNSLTVGEFTSSPGGSTMLNGAGKETIKVGATLHVGAHQAPGHYVGSLNVTVVYD